MVPFAGFSEGLIKSAMIQGVYDCPKNRIYSEDCPDVVLFSIVRLVDVVD